MAASPCWKNGHSRHRKIRLNVVTSFIVLSVRQSVQIASSSVSFTFHPSIYPSIHPSIHPSIVSTYYVSVVATPTHLHTYTLYTLNTRVHVAGEWRHCTSLSLPNLNIRMSNQWKLWRGWLIGRVWFSYSDEIELKFCQRRRRRRRWRRWRRRWRWTTSPLTL